MAERDSDTPRVVALGDPEVSDGDSESSGSSGPRLQGWSLINQRGELENTSDENSSSSECVRMESLQAVSFHPMKSKPRSGSSSSTGSLLSVGVMAEVEESFCSTDLDEITLQDTANCLDEKFEGGLKEDNPVLTPEPDNTFKVQDKAQIMPVEEVENSPENEDCHSLSSWDNNWFWDDWEDTAPAEVDLVAFTDSDGETGVETDAAAAPAIDADEGSGGISSSSVEQVSAPDETEEEEAVGCAGVWPAASLLLAEEGTSSRLDPAPSTRGRCAEVASPPPFYPGVHYHPLLHRQFSESDSENSDFVRIDHPRYLLPAQDILHASTSSSGSSSVSANFRFLQHVNMAANYEAFRHRVEEEDDDNASLPSDVDDRCESDISGVVFDSSDPDLSSVTYADMLDIPLTVGDVRRSYKHKPNSNLNAFLTMMALLTLFLALGIGIGHYMGSVREMKLHMQQVANMKALQDDYLLCLRKQQELQARVSNVNEDRIQAVAAIWKEKYEQLIVEKADLGATYTVLKKQHRDHDEEMKMMISSLDYEKKVNIELRQQTLNQTSDFAPQYSHLEKKRELEEFEEQLREQLEQQEEMEQQLQRQLVQWEQLVQELRGQLEQLEHHNQQLQSQLATAGKQLKSQKDLEIIMQESIGKELAILRQELNSAQNANLDLKEEVSKMRYGTVNTAALLASKATQTEVFAADHATQSGKDTIQTSSESANEEVGGDAKANERNSLLLENEDLKLAVGKLRYTGQAEHHKESESSTQTPFTSHKSVETQTDFEGIDTSLPAYLSNQVQIKQEELDAVRKTLAQEKARSELLESFLAEYRESKAMNDSEATLQTVTFSQCMQLWIASNSTGNWSLKEITSLFNVSGTVEKLGEVLEKVKFDPKFETLVDKTHSAVESVQKVAEDTKHAVMGYIKRYALGYTPTEVYETGDSDGENTSTQTHAFVKDEETDEQKMVDASTQTEDVYELPDENFIVRDESLISTLEAGVDNNNNDINNNKLEESCDQTNNKQKKFDDVKAMEKNQKTQKPKKKKSKGDPKADKTHRVNITAKERLEHFVNQTKESVVALTEKVQRTWHRVKNLSNELLGQKKQGPQETVEALGKVVMKSVDDFKKETSRVWKAAWKKIKHGHGWLGRRQMKKTKDNKKHKKEKKKKNHQNRKGSMRGRMHFEDAAFLAMAQNKKKVENKPQHHRKESSTNADSEYEQFWKKADFEPDDFLHDEFWEGNDREWRKHQRKFRKMHGRINRLNEELFLAMDDDDIEDFYDDLEDFDDNNFENGHLKPENLKAWLTCQLRWWKSRMYRKHGHDDLVQGCVSHLTRWQLTTLCRGPPSCHTKECKRQNVRDKRTGQFAQKSKWCQYLQKTVIMSNQGHPQEGGAMHGAQDSPPNHFPRSHRTSQNIVFDDSFYHIENIRLPTASDTSNRRTEGTVHTPHGKFHYHIDVDGSEDYKNDDDTDREFDDNSTAINHKDGSIDRTTSSEQDKQMPTSSSQWVFERAEDRESRHHPGAWYFQRADERQFERTKPWYYKRADSRREQHTKWQPYVNAPRNGK